jgi:hypothetical protein
MTRGSQQLKFGETYAKSAKNRTVQFGKLDHPILSAKPQNPEHPVSKTRTPGFSRLNIMTRKHTPIISRHSHIHIYINRT